MKNDRKQYEDDTTCYDKILRPCKAKLHQYSSKLIEAMSFYLNNLKQNKSRPKSIQLVEFYSEFNEKSKDLNLAKNLMT